MEGTSPSNSQREDTTDVLIENGNEKVAGVKRNNNLRTILIVIFGVFVFVMLASLSMMVINLYTKVTFIEELNLLQQQTRLDIFKQQENEVALFADNGLHGGDRNIGKEKPVSTKGLHLIGINQFQSISHDSGNEMKIISNWKDISGSGSNGRLQLQNNTKILVKEDGLYMIYAQITWRMKQGTAMFEISQSVTDGTHQTSELALSKCIRSFNEKYSVMKTCFTSVSTKLLHGDSVQMMVVKENYSIDYHDGLSFFGVLSMDHER